MTIPDRYRVWFLAAAIVVLCLLHAGLFHVRWYHNAGASIPVLLATFWLAFLVLCLAFRWWRHGKLPVLSAQLVGLVILLPGAGTSLSWTLWSVLSLL